MSKELVNEIHSGFGRLFDQQDYTYMIREILQILARNLDNAVLDYSLELYSLHNSPLLSEQGSGSIAAQRLALHLRCEARVGTTAHLGKAFTCRPPFDFWHVATDIATHHKHIPQPAGKVKRAIRKSRTDQHLGFYERRIFDMGANVAPVLQSKGPSFILKPL
jgi:hypothetical protein